MVAVGRLERVKSLAGSDRHVVQFCKSKTKIPRVRDADRYPEIAPLPTPRCAGAAAAAATGRAKRGRAARSAARKGRGRKNGKCRPPTHPTPQSNNHNKAELTRRGVERGGVVVADVARRTSETGGEPVRVVRGLAAGGQRHRFRVNGDLFVVVVVVVVGCRAPRVQGLFEVVGENPRLAGAAAKHAAKSAAKEKHNDVV